MFHLAFCLKCNTGGVELSSLDGEKTVNIQVLVSRARDYLPTIRSDLDLLEKLLATYTAKS